MGDREMEILPDGLSELFKIAFNKLKASTGMVDGLAGDQVQAVWAPGRIEVVGKHTDYAKGKSLVCAVDRGILMVFKDREDAMVEIISCDYEPERLCFQLNQAEEPRNGSGKYVSAILAYLRLQSVPLKGVTIVMKSSLPQNSGLSSSSAFVCGIASILARGQQLNVDTLGKIESMDLVGTRGGSQDHAAIMLGKVGHLLLLDYSDGTKVEKVIPFNGLKYALVIGVSGVSACKIGDALEKYNQLAEASVELKMERARRETEGPVAMVSAGFEKCDDTLLREGIKRSQDHAEKELGTTVPATEFLPKEAIRLGALGSTTFGAGFGGACYALVPVKEQEAFMEAWRESYCKQFPDFAEKSSFFITSPSRGLEFFRVVLDDGTK